MIILLFFNLISIKTEIIPIDDTIKKVPTGIDECDNSTVKATISCENSVPPGSIYSIKQKGFCCQGRRVSSSGNHCCYFTDEFRSYCSEVTESNYKKIPKICSQVEYAYEVGGIHIKANIDCNSNLIKNLYIFIIMIFIIF